MKGLRTLVAAVAAAGVAAGAQAQGLSSRGTMAASAVGGGADTAEIVQFDPVSSNLFFTHGRGVGIAGFNGTSLSPIGNIDLTGQFGAAGLLSISSVAIHPTEGYGVAVAIPSNTQSQVGKAVFFDTSTYAILHTADLGYHPDMVAFDSTLERILIANEGEVPAGEPETPGSLSVISLNGLTKPGLAGVTVTNYDFTVANLGAGVSLAGIRTHPAYAGTPTNHLWMEPEYVVSHGGKAYVTLQENNAIATFDFAQNLWTAIRSLGLITNTIDASDQDAGARIDDVVPGMPLPDGLALYVSGSTPYLLTANEGDARGEDKRAASVGLADGVPGKFDPGVTNTYSFHNVSGIGRLDVSTWDGDTDGDNDLDQPVAYGTRSFSIWNAETGERVFDSGSALETYTAASNTFENGRSDNKGPEPESVEIGSIGGRTYAFIALERTDDIAMFDITDPMNVTFFHLAVGTQTSPEGLDFFTTGGKSYLAVANEVSSSIEVFEAIPEPGTASLIAGCLVAGAFLRRLRRARGG